jgi:hypothetical protein
LEFLFPCESREARKLVLSIPEGIVERRTAVHPVHAFTSIGHDCVGCFIGTWKGDCFGSSSRGQPRGALSLHQVTQRQVIKFADPTRRSGHTTSYTRYKGMCTSTAASAWVDPFVAHRATPEDPQDSLSFALTTAAIRRKVYPQSELNQTLVGYEILGGF